MSYFSNPGQLAYAWRRLSDTANESGETPLFVLGFDSLHRYGLLNLLALRRIARQNLGPQHPIVVSGGDGWLWLLAMFVWRPAGGDYRHPSAANSGAANERIAERRSEHFDDAGRTVLYAGADSALYAAVLNLTGEEKDRGAAPPGLDWFVPSSTSAGVEGSDIELLPVLVGHEFMREPTEPSGDAWLQKGERWASGLLAFAILIAAFFG